MEKLKHLVRSQQLSRELIEYLFRNADDIRENSARYSNSLEGKIMVSWFYEKSTRTRTSFEAAMLKLGGSVTGTENAEEFSSVAKGESFEDTIRVISSYGDVIVLRHKKEGASEFASALSKIPVVNAGDGKGQHPTQALLDVYTMQKEFGRVDGLKIAIVGDLANGRTARSLAYLSTKFKDVSLTFVSPPNLTIGFDIKAHLVDHRAKFVERTDFDNILGEVDVVYMTRIQRERMSDEEYAKAKGIYSITEKNLHLIRKDARILHPLPHVEEIILPVEIEEKDRRIAYYRQAENGLYARMALLYHLLS